MIHYWWAVGIGCLAGYLIRWMQDSWDDLKIDRVAKRRNREWDEIHRILDGIEDAPISPAVPAITKSPLVGWDSWDLPATGWDRALVPVAPGDHQWPDQEPSARRSLRQWWDDMLKATEPRTAEQVALQVYEDVVLASGPIYHGQHRTDGYTVKQVTALNTATGEYPSLRYLRSDWRDVPLPVPAEVII